MIWTRITVDPAVMGGKPCIRGLRVTVGTIVGLMAAGQTKAELLKAYPYLEEDDLREALAYAAWRTQAAELPLVGGDYTAERHAWLDALTLEEIENSIRQRQGSS